MAERKSPAEQAVDRLEKTYRTEFVTTDHGPGASAMPETRAVWTEEHASGTGADVLRLSADDLRYLVSDWRRLTRENEQLAEALDTARKVLFGALADDDAVPTMLARMGYFDQYE